MTDRGDETRKPAHRTDFRGGSQKGVAPPGLTAGNQTLAFAEALFKRNSRTQGKGIPDRARRSPLGHLVTASACVGGKVAVFHTAGIVGYAVEKSPLRCSDRTHFRIQPAETIETVAAAINFKR